MNDLQTIETAPPPVTIDEARLAALREKARLQASIETWQPQPGDSVEGVICGAREEQGPFGPQQQVLIQRPDSSVTGVWLNGWLTAELQRQGAEIGSLISLTLVEKATTASGKRYNKLSLVIG